MNIHVEDSELKKQLFDSELIRIPFGSHVYGLNNENSDEDFICIYAEHPKEQHSFLWEHHNFQIKHEDTDYIFTTLRNFVRNLINGDMPGNLESIHHDVMKNGYFSFLYNHRKDFYSYSNLRSFLGYAKRDLKHSSKNDRLCHAYRSIMSAKKIIDDCYTPDCSEWNEYAILLDIKNGTVTKDQRKDIIEQLNDIMVILRESINIDLENGDIIRYLDIELMKKLDDWLLTVCQSQWYNEKANAVDANAFKYDVLENGIKY